MSVAIPGLDRAPFQRLHEIGKVLLQADSLEDVAPRVLALAAEDGLVRGEVLITAAAGPEHPFVWRGAQVSPPALAGMVARARAAYQALRGPPRVVRLDREPRFAAYPLVGSEGAVLGALALEWAVPADGERLAFGEDVSDLLALSMDRGARVLRAARNRDDLLSTVSHELKNLLAVLRANLELLQRSAALAGGDKPRVQLGRIRCATDRMGRLIHDLLDGGRAEARCLSVEPRRLEVAPLVADALEAAAPLAAGRSIRLRSEVPAALPRVMADAARLQQVFANLLSNAIKFSPEGGAITVRAGPSSAGAGAVTFSVQDHGAGIGEEDQPRLFDRFWQGQHVVGEGYGLGLFIVQGIVRAHGGRIWVESEVGRGATFFFTIPAAGAAP